MSDIVIRAEGLGKKYLIGHQAERERYTALRDIMVRNAKSVINKTRQVLSGQQLLAGDEIEEFWALKDINFEIKRGDRVGIIGRNGAGKSTLLKILSRITEPSTGKVTIDGRIASLLEVGTGFHPELTGRENIYLNGAILGMARAEIKKKFDEIVDFAEVEKFLDTPVKRYSSGMYVRLAFAVAAHLEPEILVVDEVLAVGDAEFQKKCLGKMEEVSKNEGRTVLLVSHNLQNIVSLCDKSILIVNGSIEFQGSTHNCIEIYTKGFFDLNPTLKPPFKQIIIKNSQGKSTNQLKIGEDFSLIFLLTPYIFLENHVLQVRISTPEGQQVLVVQTEIKYLKSLQMEIIKELILNFENLLLFPNSYFISIGIMEFKGGPVVWIPNAAGIIIIPDYNDLKQIIETPKTSIILAKHQWKVES